MISSQVMPTLTYHCLLCYYTSATMPHATQIAQFYLAVYSYLHNIVYCFIYTYTLMQEVSVVVISYA